MIKIKKKIKQSKTFEVYFSEQEQFNRWMIRKKEEGWKLKQGGLKYWYVKQYPAKGEEVELMGEMILLHSGNEMKFASVKMILE